MESLDRGGEIGCVVITGGTGSFGSAFARFLLSETDCKVRIYSRDEHKQEMLVKELELELGVGARRVTFILGDVRDEARLALACAGADAVVHAAALKTVPAGERHVDEFTKTNIDGSLNVLRAAWAAGVTRALLISSDKAVAALNAYGKTKAVAEELFVQANQWGAARGLRSAVVRGGNVWGSRGSVMEVWRRAIRLHESLILHDEHATRFHLPMADWTRYCYRLLLEMHGGEIFIPKCRAWRLADLAEAFCGNLVYDGARDGDKQHEFLIAPGEMQRVKDLGWSYVIEPGEDLRAAWNYAPWAGQAAPETALISSEHAPRLSVAELRELIR